MAFPPPSAALLVIGPRVNEVPNTDGVVEKHLAIAGVLHAITGAADIFNARSMVIAGTLGPVTGAAAIFNARAMTIAGLLGPVVGDALIDNNAIGTTEENPTAGFNTEDGADVGPFIDYFEHQSGSHTDYNFTMPDGDPGDALIVYCALNSNNGSFIEGTDRWNMLWNTDSTVFWHQCFFKIRDGSEVGGSTLDVSFPNSTNRAIVFVQVKRTAGLDVFFNSIPNNNDLAVGGSLTLSEDGSLVVLIASRQGVSSVTAHDLPIIDSGEGENLSSVVTADTFDSGSTGSLSVTWGDSGRRGAGLFGFKPLAGRPEFILGVEAQDDSDTLTFEGGFTQPIAPRRYWRVLALTDNGGGGQEWTRLKLMSSAVEVATSSMTWQATSTFSGYGANKVSNPPASPGWASDFAGNHPEGIWVDLGVGNEQAIDQIKLTPTNANRAPGSMEVSYSDDGVSWTVLYSSGGIGGGWTTNTERSFSLPTTETVAALGDMMVAAIATDSATSVDTPTGWTLREAGGPTGEYIWLFTKVVSADETGSADIVFTAGIGAGMAGVITVFRGNLARTNLTVGLSPNTDHTINAGASYSDDDLFLFAVDGEVGSGNEWLDHTDGETIVANIPATTVTPGLLVFYKRSTVAGEAMLGEAEYSTATSTARVTAAIT